VRKKTVDRVDVGLAKPPRPDPIRFIQDHMRLAPAPGAPEIHLYAAHPASGLWRLVGRRGEGDDPPPYWAYHWAGGTALARHILDRPETVAGLSVLDLGAGSGIVAIAAAKAGARAVLAADIDGNAIAAIGLNAAANNVALSAIAGDLTAAAPPAIDLITVGDLFYERELAIRVTAFLDLCLAAGVKILIGDPYRAYLPLQRLHLLAEYAVADFGDSRDCAVKPSGVFAFEPQDASSARAASRSKAPKGD
jgi:predicted nicotinamide N-methyase